VTASLLFSVFSSPLLPVIIPKILKDAAKTFYIQTQKNILKLIFFCPAKKKYLTLVCGNLVCVSAGGMVFFFFFLMKSMYFLRYDLCFNFIL
jgi:hypothetical protein